MNKRNRVSGSRFRVQRFALKSDSELGTRNSELHLCFILFALFSAALAQPQPIEEDQGVTGFGLALRKLPSVGALLYITAHPDDENNAVLAKLSRGQGIRTGLLTLTRGDGGQNEIGPELFEALGILRTEELMAVHRFDGAEQFFTRAYEFGYSFSVEETLKKWGKEEILSDMVRVIRQFRPHILVSLHPEGAGGGQHHQASARLAAQAFRLAGDPRSYPRQIHEEGLRPWQPLRLYQARGVGLSIRQAGARRPESPGVMVDLGSYDPLLGETYAEFGARALSSHRSQGMNLLLPISPRATFFYRLADATVPSQNLNQDFFEGIDVSLPGLAHYDAETEGPLRTIEEHIGRAQSAYQFSKYPLAAAEVMSGLELIRKLQRSTRHEEISFFLRKKEEDFLKAAAKGHFIDFEAVLTETRDGSVIPGEEFPVEIAFVSRPPGLATVQDLQILGPPGWKILVEKRTPSSALFQVQVPLDAQYSQPYWYRANSRIDRFAVRPGFQGVEPVTPPILVARAQYQGSGTSAWVETPVQYRWFDADSAKERRMEVKVVPSASVSLRPALSIVGRPYLKGDPHPVSVTKDFRATVQNHSPGPASYSVRIEAPAGWRIEPPKQVLNFRFENEQRSAGFRIHIPSDLGQGGFTLRAVAESEGGTYEQGFQTIAYHHIQTRHLYHPALATVKGIDVSIPSGLQVGYVMGVGDRVGAATEELGATVTYLEDEDLTSGNLGRFDVIVTGIRAYLKRRDLVANNHRLLRYVREGGHLVVQYNKYEFHENQYGPYPMQINRPHDRITVEDSPVKVVLPDHSLFHWPNRITDKDWAGWVQERGLYFLGQWDERYQPLLELQDPWPHNNQPKRGALVLASYGKGTYLYTGLSFFRQLPEGIAGAYRLWANILSLGKRNDVLSTPFHKYDDVCGWGLRGEVAKRGGGDTEASSTTNDKEIDRNPHPPKGLGRYGPISLLLLLADVSTSTRRRASIWSPSRSQHTSSYLWK